MNYFIFLTITVVVLSLVCIYAPVYYDEIKKGVIADSHNLSQDKNQVTKQPLMAMLFMSMPFIFYVYILNQPILFFYLLALSVAAYVDYVSKWVPDFLIYMCTWLSFIGVSVSGSELSLLLGLQSAMLLVAVMLLTNLVLKYKCHSIAFGTGDIYMVSSLGLWILPVYAIPYLLVAYLAAIIFAYKKHSTISFIPYLYFAFILYLSVNEYVTSI
jgi:prepilin signal peptidase PulO-like enzyme (type II secretory pathway)